MNALSPTCRSLPAVLPGVGAFPYLPSPKATCTCRDEASAHTPYPERVDPASRTLGSAFLLLPELASETSPAVPHPSDALILKGES